MLSPQRHPAGIPRHLGGRPGQGGDLSPDVGGQGSFTPAVGEGVRGGPDKRRGAPVCQGSGRLVAGQCPALVPRPQCICLPCCYLSRRVCLVDLCLRPGVAPIEVPGLLGRAGGRCCREEYMTSRRQWAMRQVGSASATFTWRCLPESPQRDESTQQRQEVKSTLKQN